MKPREKERRNEWMNGRWMKGKEKRYQHIDSKWGFQ